MTVRRRLNRKRSSTTRRHAAAAELEKLYRIEPYHRNEVSLSQIEQLRDLIDLVGMPTAAERVGVSLVTMLKVTSGFGHKLQTATAAKIREYFGG